LKTSPCPDFIDYWERGELWCLGVRVWKNECQALKCDANEPGSTMALVESPYPLPFEMVQGQGMVPTLVFAIAIHMVVHPESDLLDLLACRKTLEQARQDAKQTYGGDAPESIDS
jgi:hypothetical protein